MSFSSIKMDIYSISIVFAVFFIFIVIELVRRNKLLENYSLLWLIFSVFLILFASSPSLINNIALWLNIKYAPSVLFVFGLIFLVVYNLHITSIISKQNERIVRLTQELAILKHNYYDETYRRS